MQDDQRDRLLGKVARGQSAQTAMEQLHLTTQDVRRELRVDLAFRIAFVAVAAIRAEGLRQFRKT
jgi:hypothetical protein